MNSIIKPLFSHVTSKLLGWGHRLPAISLSCSKMRRRIQHRRALGRERASVICKAASRPRFSLVATRSHSCFPFFTEFFFTDFRPKERMLAVYWGHQNQHCLAALVQSRSLQKNDLVDGTVKDCGLGFQLYFRHKPVSLVWFTSRMWPSGRKFSTTSTISPFSK